MYETHTKFNLLFSIKSQSDLAKLEETQIPLYVQT